MWKFLIPSAANLKIAGIILASAGVAGTAFFAYTRGQDRGFQNAYSQFQTEIRQLNEDWYDIVERRDEIVITNITTQFSMLEQQIQDYIRNDERERELINRLDVLTSSLQEMRDESITTDFGMCDFSPDFERLLNAARESISRSAADSTPPTP